jgi:predicted transcriptional regulator
MPEREFSSLGFNENEREVYLAVLRAGKIAAHRVSVLTGINRTTVYSIGKKLSSLGLISEDKGQKIVYFVAEKPEKILTMLEKEEGVIQEKKKSAQSLIAGLSSVASEKHYSVPRIKFIEEADLSAYLYDALPRWQESLKNNDNTWWGFHDNSFTEHYGDWIDWSWKLAPDGFVRFFTNDATAEREMHKKHKERLTKALPEGTSFDSSLWVAGNYILMVQTRIRPHYLVEIYDEVLSRNQRALFKGLWGLAK